MVISQNGNYHPVFRSLISIDERERETGDCAGAVIVFRSDMLADRVSPNMVSSGGRQTF